MAKAGAALSAEATSLALTSTWITATSQAACAAYYVPTAIQAWAYSEMIQNVCERPSDISSA